MRRALLLVDVQQGFNDVEYWGHRSNPACERNIAALIDAWQAAGQPIVRVVHDSLTPGSPLAAATPGNDVKEVVAGPVDLEVRKSVHSSFHGTPDLHGWLQDHDVAGIAVCGITTNMCCETTARIGSDLGYDLWFVLDATAGYDLPGLDGSTATAAQLARSTAAIIAADFGRVLDTETACASVSVASTV
ncbi:MAG: isochorismatase family protein [Actinomycetota bacterium]